MLFLFSPSLFPLYMDEKWLWFMEKLHARCCCCPCDCWLPFPRFTLPRTPPHPPPPPKKHTTNPDRGNPQAKPPPLADSDGAAAGPREEAVPVPVHRPLLVHKLAGRVVAAQMVPPVHPPAGPATALFVRAATADVRVAGYARLEALAAVGRLRGAESLLAQRLLQELRQLALIRPGRGEVPPVQFFLELLEAQLLGGLGLVAGAPDALPRGAQGVQLHAPQLGL